MKQAQQKKVASSTDLQKKTNEILLPNEQAVSTDKPRGVLSSLHYDLETRWKKRVVSMSLVGRIEIFPNAGAVIGAVKRKAAILPVASIIEVARGDKGVSQGVKDSIMLHLSSDQVGSILKMLGLL